MDELLDDVLGYINETILELPDDDILRFYDLLIEEIEEKKYDLLENIG